MRRAVFAAIVACAVPAPVVAQISPGPLSRAHQSLEGATRCTQCHGPSRDAMPRLCLACHREVAWLMAQGRGWHAREAKASGKTCAGCHPDHAGREFDLIAWPAGGRGGFDHRTTGWPLQGKHAPARCERCHRSELRTGEAAALSPRKSSPGWMGLDTSCVSCHRSDDPHGNALGPECQRCHDASAWSPAPRFDHAASRYPLTGRHVDIPCARCHPAVTGVVARSPGKPPLRFRPVLFQECSNCHADPHQGRLSAKCSSCHVTRGFDVLDRREFNHASTRYPLLGKHRGVACEGCHGRDMVRPRPAFATCISCHEDRHGGEATRAGVVVDCAACHGVEGFAPSTFTVVAHRAARFPLGGRHEAVPCGKCHRSTRAPGAAAATVHLRVAFSSCTSCHADPHGSQLSGQRCEQCHSDGGWAMIRYDRADHARTRLPLEGRHAALACAACHGPARPGLPAVQRSAAAGMAGVLFRLSEARCVSCHADPHLVSGDARSRDTTIGCGGCHNAVAFTPSTIDVDSHARFVFKLDGAHRAVPCRDCHTGLSPAGTAVTGAATLLGAERPPRSIALRAVRGTTCSACHQSPHGSQFTGRADGGRCDACHGTDRFTATPRFNHDRDAAFSLAGAHARLACAQCHRTETRAGVGRVVYRPVPHRCEDCHGASRPGGSR